MKFRCERDVLLDALTTSSRAVASRGGALPALSGIHATLKDDHLVLIGSDLDLTIETSLTVSGELDGTAVFPARLITDIVRSLEPGAVNFEIKDDEANLVSGRSNFTVRLLPVDDYPRLNDTTGETVSFEASLISEALRQVVRAASHDDARPILTGVLFVAEDEGLRLVATDSYRLAFCDVKGSVGLTQGQSVLIPSKSLTELIRIIDNQGMVNLRLGERDATFEVGQLKLTTRLIEGDFPNYRQLIPTNSPNRAVVGRESMIDAIKRVKLMAKESTPIRLSLSDNSVELLAISQDVGQAEELVDASYVGEEMVIAFNPDYLVDGIEAITGDEVSIETIDGLKPAVIRSVKDDDFIYLLMPVRVS